jgi:hypothetical protein
VTRYTTIDPPETDEQNPWKRPLRVIVRADDHSPIGPGGPLPVPLLVIAPPKPPETHPVAPVTAPPRPQAPTIVIPPRPEPAQPPPPKPTPRPSGPEPEGKNAAELVALRKELGLTQGAAAEIIGVKRGTLFDAEHGNATKERLGRYYTALLTGTPA